MSFRKNNKEQREITLKWKQFCEANRKLIERIDLPTPTIETEECFADLLMHGYIDHHDDWSNFTTGKLNREQLEDFAVLVDKYFEFGYCDPGLMVVSHFERIRLAKKYPKQFSPQFAEIIENQEISE